MAYLFDDIHLEHESLSRTRQAALHILDEPLSSGTRIAILTTSGKTQLGFTNDRNKIAGALKQIKLLLPHSDCPDISHYVADLIINRRDLDALNAAAQEALVTCHAELPKHAMVVAKDAARDSLAIHDEEARRTLDTLRRIAQGMSILPGDRSIVFFSPGFFVPAGIAGMQEVIDRATRSGVVIQALEAQTLHVSSGFDAAREVPTSQEWIGLESAAQIADADALHELVDATGGLLQHNNDYDAGLKRLSERSNDVYLLSFSPSDNQADGTYHKLKVTVNEHSGLEIQARRGYTALGATQDAEKEAKEEIQNALLSHDETSEIPLSLKSSATPSPDGKLKLNLLLHVDVKQLQFEKQGGRNRSKLKLVLGLFDEDGGSLSVLAKDLPLDLSDADLNAFLETGIDVQSDLDLKPQTRFLRIVLRDAQGHMSTMNRVIGK